MKVENESVTNCYQLVTNPNQLKMSADYANLLPPFLGLQSVWKCLMLNFRLKKKGKEKAL